MEINDAGRQTHSDRFIRRIGPIASVNPFLVYLLCLWPVPTIVFWMDQCFIETVKTIPDCSTNCLVHELPTCLMATQYLSG